MSYEVVPCEQGTEVYNNKAYYGTDHRGDHVDKGLKAIVQTIHHDIYPNVALLPKYPSSNKKCHIE